MFLKNNQVVYLYSMIILLICCAGCQTVVPHTGCYVADSRLRGTYTGECKDGKAHGRGKSVGKDFYEGQFFQGVAHGQGTYIWSDGDRYIGQFQNGQAHGRGVLRMGGEEYRGVWKDNELQE